MTPWRALRALGSALLLACAAAPTAWAGTAAATAQATSAVTAPVAASAPAATGRREAPEITRIIQRGELIVGMLRSDSPPFFYVRDEKLQGTDVAMAHEIAKELGVTVRFDRSAASFNEVVDKVSRNEVDMGISKISRTLARSRAVLFSEPYLTLHHALVLNRLEFAKLARERTPEQTMQDYTGTLGVIAKSSFGDFARVNFPKAQMREYASWENVVDAVQRGEVVAGYRDEFEVKRLLAEKPTLSLKLRSLTLKDRRDTIGVAIPADAPTLRSFVDLYLESRKTKLEIEDVLKALPQPEKKTGQS
jgi:ABC-type amino acid transport substrate-binding protein